MPDRTETADSGRNASDRPGSADDRRISWDLRIETDIPEKIGKIKQLKNKRKVEKDREALSSPVLLLQQLKTDAGIFGTSERRLSSHSASVCAPGTSVSASVSDSG